MAKRETQIVPLKAEENWDSPGGRARWLLAHRWKGSRSAMANDIGVSLTGLINVVTGAQEPGRRLLTAIATSTDVNPAWLLMGKGEPFLSSGIPVAHHVLPGSPQERPDLLTDEKGDEVRDLYSPSRYWLKILRGNPLIRYPFHKVKVNDMLLMETKRTSFPEEDCLVQNLCVIRIPGTNPPEHQLVEVTHRHGSVDDEGNNVEEPSLVFETFESDSRTVTQIIVEEDSLGNLTPFKRLIRKPEAKGPGKKPRLRYDAPHDLSNPLRIDYRDIKAVCILLVRRP
jgi:hypothetical protein